jgi:hypothetical protein
VRHAVEHAASLFGADFDKEVFACRGRRREVVQAAATNSPKSGPLDVAVKKSVPGARPTRGRGRR